MKQLTIMVLAIMCMVCGKSIHAQVAINADGAEPHASAILDVSSTDMGLLIPRMSATQRDNITDPATGLMVYVTDDGNIYIFDGSSWIAGIGSGNTGWEVSGNDVYTSVSGFVGIGTSNPNNKLHIYSEPGAALRLQGNDGWISLEMADETGSQTAAFGFANFGNGIGSMDLANRKTGGEFNFYTKDAGTGTATTRMHISNDGWVGIGTNSPGSLFELSNAGSDPYENTSQTLSLYSDEATAYLRILYQRSHSSVEGDLTSASAVTQDGENLGQFRFNGIRVNGSGGSATSAGWFEMVQKGSATSSGIPGQFQVTTADGAGNRDTRFVISPTGNVGIGTTDPTEALDIEGNIDMNSNQIKNMVIETRTSDPTSPAVGQIWLRTDL